MQRIRRIGLLGPILLAGIGLLVLVGCSQSEQPKTATTTADETKTTSEPEELTILCGSSFAPPIGKLAKMFEDETGVKSVISFGGSEDLLPQVKLGKTGDIFVTHHPYMQYTEDAKAMLRWIHVGYVAPVLVVQKGNPKKLKSINDLAGSDLQVLLPNPEYSTCGEMVFALLDKKGIKDAVLKNVGNAMFRSHSDIGNQMKLGSGDAAMMWNGVAHNYLDAVDIVPTPYEYDNEIRVGVIGLSYSKKTSLVEQFLAFIDDHGKAVFEEFGYVK